MTMHHLQCWVIAKRNAHERDEVYEDNHIPRVFADIELINFIEKEIASPSLKFLDMNTMNKKYKDLITENDELKESYKRYLNSISFQKCE